MNRKDYILFDLDGTLTDPKEGITKSVQHALEHFGIQTDDLDSLTPFIGPPLRDSFKGITAFPMSRMGGGAGIPGVFQRPGLGPEQGVSRHKGNAGSPEGSRESAVSGNLQTGGVCQEDTGSL